MPRWFSAGVAGGCAMVGLLGVKEAAAQPISGAAEQFGSVGQLAISSDAELSISATSGSAPSKTILTLGPAADYFVIDHFSVGGALIFQYSSIGDTTSTSFRLGPRAGYNFGLTDLLSLWPRLGFSFSTFSSSTPAPNNLTVSTSDSALALNLFVPLMVHPAPHFFAGFGPYLDVDLTGDAKATSVGARLTLGGWL